MTWDRRKTMRLRGATIAGLSIALAIGGAPPALAQTGTVSAMALVGTAAQAIALRDLQFGRVFPGFNKTVAYTDNIAGDKVAGLVQIRGVRTFPVLVNFNLPGQLYNGAIALPVDSWTACHNTTNTTTGCTPFTPSSAATPMTLSAAPPTDPWPRIYGYRYIFMGATVRAPASQAAGTYTGTIVVNVVYAF